MEIKDICCEDCLFDELLEKAESLGKNEGFTFFAKRDLVAFIIESFVKQDEYSLGVINFEGCDFDYFDEYVVSIDDDKTIWCEPAIRHSEVYTYNCDYGDIAYVYQGDVRQEIIDRLLDDKANVVLFGFEDEDFGLTEFYDEEECNEKDTDSHGFTISSYGEDGCYSSYFFYSTDKDIIQEEYEKLKKRKIGRASCRERV